MPRGHRVDGGSGSAEVTPLISWVPDARKRLGCRIYLEGMRVRKGNLCVASVCGCDLNIAAQWITESRAILAAEIGV